MRIQGRGRLQRKNSISHLLNFHIYFRHKWILKFCGLKKKKFSEHSRNCYTETFQPGELEAAMDGDHGASLGMFMVIVPITHHWWHYQPGAAPQRHPDPKFSSQAFSPAPALLSQEGSGNNWKNKNEIFVILFKDYQVNYGEGEK